MLRQEANLPLSEEIIILYNCFNTLVLDELKSKEAMLAEDSTRSLIPTGRGTKHEGSHKTNRGSFFLLLSYLAFHT